MGKNKKLGTVGCPQFPSLIFGVGLTLFAQIGDDKVAAVITRFYEIAFEDPIIGHFFFEKDRQHITAMQIAFATAMLGGPRNYAGKSLQEAHASLRLRRPHFDRRQVLMAEVLAEKQVPAALAEQWLALEQGFRDLILRN